MKSILQKIKHSSRKKRVIFSVFAAALLIAGGWWVYTALKPEPTYPLGDRMEYLGKEDYGCYGICDSYPGSIYYYDTDMSIEEVIDYFKRASVAEQPETLNGETYFGIKTPSGETVYMEYYVDKASRLKDTAFRQKSTQDHLLLVSNSEYQAAKDSL